ncbi:hypothetical protein ABIE18_000133 [Arthrobacter sp. 2762]
MGSLNPDTLAALADLGPVTLWLLAVGFFSPLVIAVIQQSRWSVRKQSIVAFLFYVAVAAITAWLAGIFNTAGIIVAILVIFITAGNSYKLLWKPTGVAPAIQAATPIGNTNAAQDAVRREPEHRA